MTSDLTSVVIAVATEADIHSVAQFLTEQYQIDICEIDKEISCIFAGVAPGLIQKLTHRDIKAVVPTEKK